MTTLICSCAPGSVVVNTDDGAPTASSAPPPAATTTRPSNAHLVNAFDYASEVDGSTGYYFTSPSGRWECAVLPRTRAGCQSAQAPTSALPISGAPDEVPGPDGDPAAPNILVVDRTDDPQFSAVSAPQFGLDPGPAVVLPFNRILAVAGFRCNVQESSGISCLSELSGKGFTFSADGYTMTYTDVPADAP
nr:hypothetical protein [Mycolicibacterium vanbaalenii]